MKLAIVTGGSSGIGRGVALRLAARNVGVILTYHRQSSAADAVLAAIHEAGGSAAALALDLRDVASLDGFVARTKETMRTRWNREQFDYLVNNAGMGGGTPFEAITESSFDEMFTANFKGPYFLTQKLLPSMVDGGQIVNLSSGAARMAPAGYSVYGPTKAALSSATKYWAKELAPRGIRVNSVSPGPVLTNLSDGAFAKHPEYIAPLAAQTLVGRIAEADDVASVIDTLLSDACRYMTAADIDVSGGFMV